MSSPNRNFLLIALLCGGLIASALYLQHALGQDPCYLCIVQRVFVSAIGTIALVAFFHNPGPSGRRLYGFSIALTALVGSGFSLRQLWLQHLPADQVPICGPPAEYLFERFPIDKWLPLLLQGNGDCAKVDWTFLGLSIAGWMLIFFLLLAIFALWLGLRRARPLLAP